MCASFEYEVGFDVFGEQDPFQARQKSGANLSKPKDECQRDIFTFKSQSERSQNSN
jgi:hypothetical protein